MLRRIIKKVKKLTRNYQTRKEGARLIDFCKKNKIIKLHFGCGPRILKGWINIDLSFVPYVDKLYNYTDKYYPPEIRGTKDDFYAINITEVGLPLPDNSVDVIFHEDFIEHLDQRGQIIFLAETYRTLKPGSVHRVNTPD
ncbi:MAG: methyltransferase domain-containing protein, partial [bacterium]